MDAVQDALMRMLDYADKPAAEWAPLFWSILRRRVIDVQRRRRFRLPFWRDNRDAEGGGIDWADPAPTRHRRMNSASSTSSWWTRCAACPPASARPSPCACCRTGRGHHCPRHGLQRRRGKTHLARARQALQDYLEIHP